MSKKLKILITSAVVVLAVAVIYVALNSQALSMKRYLRDSSNISIELTTPSYNDRKQVLGDTLEYTDLKTTEEDSAFRDAFDSIFGITKAGGERAGAFFTEGTGKGKLNPSLQDAFI